jgi:hypothetical protein
MASSQTAPEKLFAVGWLIPASDPLRQGARDQPANPAIFGLDARGDVDCYDVSQHCTG